MDPVAAPAQALLSRAGAGDRFGAQVGALIADLRARAHGFAVNALHRLERRGWIKARWGASENNRRAKYYELTKSGRRQLEAEKSEWQRLATAVAQVLETS